MMKNMRVRIICATALVLLTSVLLMTCSENPDSRLWSIVRQSSGETRFTSVHFVDNNVGWVAGWRGVVLRTEDKGETWTYHQTCTKSNLDGIYFVDASEGWAVGGDGSIVHTEDGGKTWELQVSNTSDELNGVYFVDSDHGWAVGGVSSGIIIHTNDLLFISISSIRVYFPIFQFSFHNFFNSH